MIGISQDVLVEELSLAQRILTKWVAKAEAGMPSETPNGSEEYSELWEHNFCSELLLVSKKLEALAQIVVETQLHG